MTWRLCASKDEKHSSISPDEADDWSRPSTCTARHIQAAASKAAHAVKTRSKTIDGEVVVVSDIDDGNNFWEDIELPELMLTGGWSSACVNVDATWLVDGEFTACLLCLSLVVCVSVHTWIVRGLGLGRAP
ncbi:PREDICTED: ethylene-responsive transcription factor ERF023-like [Tarenaya hassleriana]|uniref:ethylene-responsive transcription factor ERF023-like n=1 Tax=Tarenaya hassleriana TaxID=28532 RepID=UPI00053C4532|nr:PREDICTED: ethylene-responsive transcription factor ERF023-like [Tarenaya hassleriana]